MRNASERISRPCRSCMRRRTARMPATVIVFCWMLAKSVKSSMAERIQSMSFS